MKITLIGSDYSEFFLDTCLTEFGSDVHCLSVAPEKIAILQQSGMPIYESGLKDLIKSNVALGCLRFTSDIAKKGQS